MASSQTSSLFPERASQEFTSKGRTREVVWGWRRSAWDETVGRLVYFAAECEFSDNRAKLNESRLVVKRRGGEICGIYERANQVKGAVVEYTGDSLSVSVGPVGHADRERTERLGNCRRHQVLDFSHIPETPEWRQRVREISRMRPRLVVYAGSGLSYEAGIPMLETMHKLVGVDDGLGTDFCLGNSDPLIDRLAAYSFSGFADKVEEFHSICARARPSPSHNLLRRAYERGDVSLVLTDNVDDIFERRFGIPTLRTRGDGLISLKYDGLDTVLNLINSIPHALLVVGVSADRRGIVEALAPLVPTIVVNPGLPVSPHSKNLDYLGSLGFDERGISDQGHVFIKQPARTSIGDVLSLLQM